MRSAWAERFLEMQAAIYAAHENPDACDQLKVLLDAQEAGKAGRDFFSASSSRLSR